MVTPTGVRWYPTVVLSSISLIVVKLSIFSYACWSFACLLGRAVCSGSLPFFFSSSPKDIFPLLLERVGRRERNTDEERTLISCLSYAPRLGIICTRSRDWTHCPGVCPGRYENLQHFAYRTTLQQTESRRLEFPSSSLNWAVSLDRYFNIFYLVFPKPFHSLLTQ